MAFGPVSGGAGVLMTQEEALAGAFPDGARIERKTVFLTEAQVRRAQALAGTSAPIGGAMVVAYVGSRDSTLLGTAYFDTHVVRTLKEAIMVVVDSADAVAQVVVLAFLEPPEYQARPAWLEQFTARRLDDELSLKRGVRWVTGATLSARAVTAAVRRVLAIHTVMRDVQISRGQTP